MATGIGVVVAIAVTFLLSGRKILNEYERSVVFRLGRLIPYRVRLRPWIRCATAAAERSLTRLCDPGSIPPMLTGRGPNGRLRVLYATIVLLRLVSPDQRKIVGWSNRAPSEQAPWSRLGDMPVGERSETRPKRGRSCLTTPNNDGSRHGQDGD